MVKGLRVWAKKMHGVVQPVVVVSTSMFNLPLAIEFTWQQNFNQNALLLLQRYLAFQAD